MVGLSINSILSTLPSLVLARPAAYPAIGAHDSVNLIGDLDESRLHSGLRARTRCVADHALRFPVDRYRNTNARRIKAPSESPVLDAEEPDAGKFVQDLAELSAANHAGALPGNRHHPLANPLI
jgi:hypothetical protein